MIGRAALDDRAGKLEDRSFRASITPPPIELGPWERLNLGANYRYTGLELNGGAAFANEPMRRHLHALDATIGYSHIFDRRWVASIGVIPGLRTDFQETFSERDFQVGGYLLVTYLIGGDPHFKFSFGLFGQTHWPLTPISPLISIDYKNDSFAIDVGVSGFNTVIRLGDRAEFGLFGRFSADWYHVMSGNAPQVDAARFLRLVEFGVGPQVNVRAFGPVWLNAKVGYTFSRRGTFGDADRNEIGGVSLDPAGAFFGQIGLSVRTPSL